MQDDATNVRLQTVSLARDRRLPAPACAPEAIDLADVSAPIGETCSALGLSLREGDVEAAERLFGFVVDQVADHRTAVTGVLAPMLFREMQAPATADWPVFVNAANTLLQRLRRPVTTPGEAGVLLLSSSGGITSLALQIVSVLLDHTHVANTVQFAPDEEMFGRALSNADVSAVAVGVADIADVLPIGPVIHQVRRSGTPVVVVTHTGFGDASTSDATAVVSAQQPGPLTDLLLRLRGPLSPGEAEVLRMAADGYTNNRIAHELDISVSAVKARLESGYGKLHAADRTHAVAIALRKRWIL